MKQTATPATVEGDVRVCPPDMIEIEGEYCPWVEQRCLRWRSHGSDDHPMAASTCHQ